MNLYLVNSAESSVDKIQIHQMHLIKKHQMFPVRLGFVEKKRSFCLTLEGLYQCVFCSVNSSTRASNHVCKKAKVYFSKLLRQT